MNTDPHEDFANADAAPSADFINAISEFFDTDPQDLLTELGYYHREDTDALHNAMAEMNAQQE